MYSVYYKSQTTISIFARSDVEKYLKFKIQKSNKNLKFFLKKGCFPSGQTSKKWPVTVLLTNSYCPIELQDNDCSEINHYKYIQSLYSRFIGIPKDFE